MIRWDEKLTLLENAKRNGKGLGWAYQYSNYHGLKFARIKKIMPLKWDESLSTEELAKLNNTSYQRVMYYKKKFGLKCCLQKQRRLNKVNKLRVVSFLRKEGFAWCDIGRLFSVTRQRAEQMGIGI